MNLINILILTTLLRDNVSIKSTEIPHEFTEEIFSFDPFDVLKDSNRCKKFGASDWFIFGAKGRLLSIIY